MNAKYPHLTHIESARPGGITHEHWRTLRGVSREVRRRTGCSVYVDVRYGRVLFGYIGRDGDLRTPWQSPLWRGGDVPNRFDPVTDEADVDDVCRLIGLARVPEKQKRYWESVHKRREKSEDEARRDAEVHEMLPEWFDRVSVTESKKGMHSGYRRSHVVNGLKQSA